MDGFDRLAARVSRYVEAARIPAIALGIVRGGRLVHEMGLGTTQVTADTLFPSCSTAKPVTAMAIMKLVEDGVLELDRPVAAFPGDRGATLRQLLSHTSGLSPDLDIPPRFFDSPGTALRDHVSQDIPTFARLPAGDVVWYSNPGFNLAGHVAADRAGLAFPAFVDEVVLRPLGMSRTTFEPASALSAEATAILPAEFRGVGPPVPFPAGGAVTTVRDLSRLAVCLLSGGGNVLAPATVSLMHTVHADAYTRPPRRYGLGFDIEEHRGRKLVTHGGGGFGCGSTFVLVPDEQVAVIVLFNHPAGYGVRAGDILDELLGEPPREDPREPAGGFSTGTFRCPVPDHPAEIAVAAGPVLLLDGQRLPLGLVDDLVYATEDGQLSVGFVPGGDYVVLDAHGLGLVSGVPYRRVRNY